MANRLPEMTNLKFPIDMAQIVALFMTSMFYGCVILYYISIESDPFRSASKQKNENTCMNNPLSFRNLRRDILQLPTCSIVVG